MERHRVIFDTIPVGVLTLDLTLNLSNIVDIGGSGDVVFEIGTVITTNQIGSMPFSIDSEKYVTIWKHQADGSWKIRAHIWNSTMKK